MSYELVNITWFESDKSGDLIDDSTRNGFCVDLKNKKILSEYDDVGHVEKPIFFTMNGLGQFMEDEIEEDKEGFVDDELTTKIILEHFTRLQEPATTATGYNLMAVIRWKRPTFGEFKLVYNFESWQSNRPDDPVEYDMNLDCQGVLGYDYKIVKK